MQKLYCNVNNSTVLDTFIISFSRGLILNCNCHAIYEKVNGTICFKGARCICILNFLPQRFREQNYLLYIHYNTV